MKKLASLVAVMAAVVATGFVAPVFADSPGQLSNGATNYKVRNVTQNTDYGQSTSVSCNETVKYSVTLANSDYGLLKNLNVRANLATGAINASASNAANAATAVSGNVTVTKTQGNLVYVPGSTVRIDSQTNAASQLADGVAGNGVNAGDLNGSTYTFVQFQAKLDCSTPPVKITVCELASKTIVTINESDFDASKYTRDLAKCAPTPPTPGQITVCEIASKKVVNISENAFDASKYTKDLSVCAATPVAPTTPATIAATGPTGTLATMFGLSAIAAGIAYFVQRRRNILG
jgi:hypothetical protein